MDKREYLVVSNNAGLEPGFDGRFAVRKISGGLEEVYDAVGELLESGHSLVSSPLPANVPLIRSPVRSVILKKSARRYDAQGLLVLEKARERTAALGVTEDRRIRADLETIDRDHLVRAIRQLEELGL